MAPCIEKGCNDSFGDKFSLIYCLFHLKEIFLKKFTFKTTTSLRECLKKLMQGKISENMFHNLWMDEECEINGELKGHNHFGKIAHHFLSSPSIHKRNIISTQRSEMFNNVIKLKSRNAYYLLQECFIVATRWFDQSAARVNEKDQIITDVANEIIDKMIIKEAHMKFYDILFHQVDKNGSCFCSMQSDLGIPCPNQIGFFREKKLKFIKLSQKISFAELTNKLLLQLPIILKSETSK